MRRGSGLLRPSTFLSRLRIALAPASWAGSSAPRSCSAIRATRCLISSGPRSFACGPAATRKAARPALTGPVLLPGPQRKPRAHFSKHCLGLADHMHPRAPLSQRLILAALGLGGQLRAPLYGIGGGAQHERMNSTTAIPCRAPPGQIRPRAPQAKNRLDRDRLSQPRQSYGSRASVPPGSRQRIDRCAADAIPGTNAPVPGAPVPDLNQSKAPHARP